MCLAGGSTAGGVSVTTVKNQSWWQEAVGSEALAMAEEVTRMCGDDATLRDVAALQPFAASYYHPSNHEGRDNCPCKTYHT